MPRKTLTARSVVALRPRRGRDQDYYFDAARGAPAGFGVKVSARGSAGVVSRQYVVAYRMGKGRAGRRRYMGLGAVGDVELAVAREDARAALRKAAAGIDPQEEARAAAAVTPSEPLTVAALVGKFIKAGEKTKAAKTTREYKVMLKGELQGSAFGDRQAVEVRRPDVREFLEAIAERGPVQANRVYQLVRAAFTWGLGEDLVERNPCEGLMRPAKERPRDRVLSDAELRVVLTALDAEEVEKGTKRRRRLVPEVVAVAIKLLVLAGTRRNETLRARWQDLDLERGEWNIPGELRKGGADLTVPLSAQAKAVLTDLQDEVGDSSTPWVFAGGRGASIAANPGRVGATLRLAVGKTSKKLKVRVAPFTLHDLRRTCATGCAELGAPPHVVALILGHQGLPGAGRVTAIYDRARRVREVRPWLDTWGRHVEQLATGEVGNRAGADVVPIGRQG